MALSVDIGKYKYFRKKNDNILLFNIKVCDSCGCFSESPDAIITVGGTTDRLLVNGLNEWGGYPLSPSQEILTGSGAWRIYCDRCN